jgi:hypothetical protein
VSRRTELCVVAAWITACSFTSLEDLKGDPKDASVSDQCVSECIPIGGGGAGFGGTGGKDATTGGFGGGTGGLGGDSSVGGAAGSSDGGEEADAVSPCTTDPNCQQCCVSTTGNGAADYVQAIHDCICTLTTTCQTDCASYCTTNNLDAICTQCLGSSEVQQCLALQCSTDDCQAYTACVGQC